MSEKLEWLSPQKFANWMGVDKGSVIYAIKSGRISEAVKRLPNGFQQIHAQQAKALWIKNTKPNNMSILNRAKPFGESEPQAVTTDLGDEDPNSLHAAKRRREFALAEMAEIELAEKLGDLVRVADVRKMGFEAARITRDSLLNIPNRIADELASLKTRDEVHELLTKELFEALSSLERIHNVGDSPIIS